MSSSQMSFVGMRKSQPQDRLFLAIFPDASAQEQLADLAMRVGVQNGLRGDVIRRDRLHITLHHLGDHAELRRDIVDDAIRAAEKVRVPPFAVSLDEVVSFAVRRDSKPCVLLASNRNAELFNLHKVLGLRLMSSGLGKYVSSRFTPPVTLRYDREIVSAHSVAPVAWEVREFALVHSLLGKTEHRTLASWGLSNS